MTTKESQKSSWPKRKSHEALSANASAAQGRSGASGPCAWFGSACKTARQWAGGVSEGSWSAYTTEQAGGGAGGEGTVAHLQDGEGAEQQVDHAP
jgi:hypothetical protein